MAWTYILKCADGSFYVGSARDVEQRIQQHAAGGVDSYTRTCRPVELVWATECSDIGEAYALERKLQGWRREKKIVLIEGRFKDLPGLSRSKRPPGA